MNGQWAYRFSLRKVISVWASMCIQEMLRNPKEELNFENLKIFLIRVTTLLNSKVTCRLAFQTLNQIVIRILTRVWTPRVATTTKFPFVVHAICNAHQYHKE